MVSMLKIVVSFQLFDCINEYSKSAMNHDRRVVVKKLRLFNLPRYLRPAIRFDEIGLYETKSALS